MTTIPKSVSFLTYDRTLGIAAMDARGFYSPIDIAIRPGDGRIYAQGRSHEGDPSGLRITVLDYESNYYGDFGKVGEADGDFTWPTAIALDKDGNIYVSDEYLQRISIFDPEVKFLRKWGTEGSGDGEFDGPAGLAFDSDDNIWLTDHRNNRVQKYTKDGKFLMCFGEGGTGPGQFNLPWGITVAPSGDIYVVDWRNDRIQRFTSAGKFVAAYGESGHEDHQLHRPSSVAVDADGYMYIADWGNEHLKVFAPDGGFVQALRGQATVSPWAQEFLDSNPDEKRARATSNLEPYERIHTTERHQVSSYVEKLFWAPISVKLDTQGRVHVVDRNRHRIQVYKKNA